MFHENLEKLYLEEEHSFLKAQFKKILNMSI